ncbi:MAG: phage/plasmid primase, P4 family [Angelakisella sp.]|nr:phage/plasmid primase, P4 family [Angelakisella sp.]
MPELKQPAAFFDTSHDPMEKKGNEPIQPACFAKVIEAPPIQAIQALLPTASFPLLSPPQPRTAHIIAQEFKRKCPLALVEGALYCFNDICYQLLDQQAAYQLIFMHQQGDVAAHGNGQIVRQVYELLLMDFSLCRASSTQLNYCAFLNGVLDLDTGIFTQPCPDLFLTSFVDCCYDELAYLIPTPAFDAYLHQVTGGDSILTTRIWESLGYLVTPDMSAKKFFILYGPGDTGKSVFGSFVTNLFPTEAVSAVDIHRIADRFALSELVGKRVNASMDLSSGTMKPSTVSTIKILTGGDLLTAERKYSPAFKFQNTCKLLFALNGRLSTYEEDQAFINRIVLLPFLHPVPHEQQDRNLSEKLLAEKQGIIHKALQYYRQLRTNNYAFTGDAQVSELLRQQFTSASSDAQLKQVIQDFVNAKCVFQQDKARTQTGVLYEAYCNFCSEQGFLQVADSKQFSRYFGELYPMLPTYKWRENGQENPRNGYLGIALR